MNPTPPTPTITDEMIEETIKELQAKVETIDNEIKRKEKERREIQVNLNTLTNKRGAASLCKRLRESYL